VLESLWIALPSEQELVKAERIYQAPDDINQIGPASVLLGKLGVVTGTGSRLAASTRR
jgi:hypothetical protein